ncbi:biotin transporter BioY [Priestia koreensis]|uniref:biotin transporter BioY n=1 Tax=Priestia koreensis TaxID=284581 RepID=UPI001F565971|nr:biotin transporter BioY [Priestia koreensis]MCM3004700.1 biotin transporter BioY [Priestia koreensis]UNL85511.1 biotin transporter BioY [Priestia koreensis]
MEKRQKLRTIDLTMAAMFVALMAIGANITSFAPFLQVANIPLTMQPFFTVLAGLLLGSRIGALSMTVYMIVGLAGAPVFAQFGSGFDSLLGPSGGFIVSYIFGAYAAGKVVELKGNYSLSTFIIASLAGVVMIYLVGTNLMYLALKTWIHAPISYAAAWNIMALFALKDLVFTLFCAFIGLRIYKALRNTTYFKTKQATQHKIS